MSCRPTAGIVTLPVPLAATREWRAEANAAQHRSTNHDCDARGLTWLLCKKQMMRATKRALPLISCLAFAACTALDSTAVPNAKVDEKKPHVGHYYFLPKALVTIEGAPDAKGNFLISSSASLVADRRYQYFLRWKPNAMSEDIITNLDVDSDGMLTSVNYSAEDKTPAVISDLVTTTINVMKIAGNLGRSLAAEKQPFRYTFDPFDGAETGKVRHELEERQSLVLHVSPKPRSARNELARELDAGVLIAERASDPQGGGVFYHPPTTIELLFEDKPKAKDTTTKTKDEGTGQRDESERGDSNVASVSPTPAVPKKDPATPDKTPKKSDGDASEGSTTAKSDGKPITLCHMVMTIPNVDKVVCFRLGRAAFTKRETNLAFAHGMPTKLVFKQPSAVQAVTGTISTITSTVATAVPTLVNISDSRKVAELQSEKSVLDARTNLLTSQQQLAAKQKELDGLTSGSGNPAPTNRNDETQPSATQRQLLDLARDSNEQLRDEIKNLRERIKTLETGDHEPH